MRTGNVQANSIRPWTNTHTSKRIDCKGVGGAG